jgi:ketosteroid isomerase-like protein
VVRFLRLLPVGFVRLLPPVGWWALKRLPRHWSEWFLATLVREIYAEFSKPGVELDDDLLDVLVEPGVEWNQPDEFPERGRYRGHAGVREELRDFLTAWSNFRSDVRSVTLDPAREVLLVTVHHEGRGLTSGVEANLEEFHVYRIRRGRVRRMDMFLDGKAAAEARYRQPT